MSFEDSDVELQEQINMSQSTLNQKSEQMQEENDKLQIEMKR